MQYVVSEPEQQAKFVVIWMPGLGAGYEDMAGLAQAITWSDMQVRHIFLQAPERPVTLNGGMRMPAWYDILGADLASRQDYLGVEESSELIERVIREQINLGMTSRQIYLAGFSQGGAMALYTGLKFNQPLGGIVAFSAYIPCVDRLNVHLDPETPVFMGHGQYDPVVQPKWTQQSLDHLKQLGFKDTTLKSYPIDHSVSPEEIADTQHWFHQQMAGGNR